eukprot:333563-Chlamydomonas_euryale.AAC.2
MPSSRRPERAVVCRPERALLLVRQSPHLRRRVGQRGQHVCVVKQSPCSGVHPDLAQQQLEPPEAGCRRREAAADGGLRRAVVLHYAADVLEQGTTSTRCPPGMTQNCSGAVGGEVGGVKCTPLVSS